jgi:CHAD domain-containing protein
VIEGNLMEKNPDEIAMMLDQNYSKQLRQQQLKNKPKDPMMVEIVVKMHDEENLHQMRIMLSQMVSLDPSIQIFLKNLI